jgi:hypothetical protein
MALASLQRRASRLEKFFVVDNVAHYPPLTTDEMTALANRIADGEKCTAVETRGPAMPVYLWRQGRRTGSSCTQGRGLRDSHERNGYVAVKDVGIDYALV